MKARCRRAGFSLVEMAVVLAVAGLLLGGLLLPLAARREARAEAETAQTLARAQEALLGFAALNGRLPCPATAASQGQEASPGGACAGGNQGFLPAAALGLQPVDDQGRALDGWHQPLRYAVVRAKVGGIAEALTTAGGLRSAGLPAFSTYLAGNALLSVCTSGGAVTAAGSANAACTAAGRLTDNAVAVVYSTGADTATGGDGPDERHNPSERSPVAADPAFVLHPPSGPEAAGGEFDDRLVWLSPHLLIHTLLAAGGL